jgi:hypothetical protein
MEKANASITLALAFSVGFQEKSDLVGADPPL